MDCTGTVEQEREEPPLFSRGGLWLVLKAIQDYFQNSTCRNWSDGVQKPNLTSRASLTVRYEVEKGLRAV